MSGIQKPDIHSLWQHRWLNPKTEVKSSPICATGIFAKTLIKKGEIIRVTGGVILPKNDVAKYNSFMDYEVDNIFLDISDDFAIAPSPSDLKTTATINHSCEPNAGFLDTITIIAIKDILPGNEVCWDYAFSQTAFKTFKCRCLTSKCRKTITPGDWEISSIQQKYFQYYSPYIKAKLA